MAEVSITEYKDCARDASGNLMPFGQEPALAHQIVAIGVASAQSAAFHENTKFIHLDIDTACRIAIGSNPTASATSRWKAANSSENIGVVGGTQLAVIQA